MQSLKLINKKDMLNVILASKSAVAYGIFRLFKFASENPEEAGSFLGWLICAAIETAIISLVVAVIASKVFDQDFGDWFGGSCIVVGIIEIILGIISLF